MNNSRNKVLVINYKGSVVAEYDSVKAVAEEYHTDPEVIRKYINNGNIWKKEKVFFDYAM